MSDGGYHGRKIHHSPNDDVLVSVDVVKAKAKFLGIEYGTTKFRLRMTHTYESETYHLQAPKGYVFDGATVPRIFWSVFERFGPWTRAALYHDILYDRRIGTKVEADAFFLSIMEADGVPGYLRYPMYLAVLLWPPNIFYWRQKERRNIGTGYKKRKLNP